MYACATKTTMYCKKNNNNNKEEHITSGLTFFKVHINFHLSNSAVTNANTKTVTDNITFPL